MPLEFLPRLLLQTINLYQCLINLNQTNLQQLELHQYNSFLCNTMTNVCKNINQLFNKKSHLLEYCENSYFLALKRTF